MTEDVGHLFAKLLSNLFLGFVFLTRAPFHHEVALNQLTHLLLEFEDIPVAVSFYPKFAGIEIGDFFDLSGNFVDVHER